VPYRQRGKSSLARKRGQEDRVHVELRRLDAGFSRVCGFFQGLPGRRSGRCGAFVEDCTPVNCTAGGTCLTPRSPPTGQANSLRPSAVRNRETEQAPAKLSSSNHHKRNPVQQLERKTPEDDAQASRAHQGDKAAPRRQGGVKGSPQQEFEEIAGR
jgi:hypothetical protein